MIIIIHGKELIAMNIFSINLNRLIAKSGKSQKQIAEEMGISPTTFNTWCVGKIVPGLKKIQIIADYFGVDKSDIINPYDPKEAEILSALEKNIVRNYREADKQHKSIVLLALGLME